VSHALVIGGLGGLGIPVVKRLRDDGHTVCIVTRRHPETLDEASEKLGENLYSLDGLPDVTPATGAHETGASRPLLLAIAEATDASAMSLVVQRCAKLWGSLDACVCLAGGFEAGETVENTDEKTWRSMFAENVDTVFATLKAAIPYIKLSQNGRIVTVSAQVVDNPPPKAAAYVAAKAAVAALTKAVARELDGTSASANCIAPRIIDTPANRSAMPNADTSRWTKPEAIADVIAFLLSPASSAINGAVIPV
jgi:NAD(P)-dependent dehydrogenase (short-subunit alcohol dehydrogenase family)